MERLDVLLKLLPRYADWGYQELYLHLEDAVEYPSLPGVARKHAFTYRQLGRLVGTASRVGVQVVPIVNLLGHTQYLVKHPALRDLNELRDPSGDPLTQGQICPLHPRTPEVAEKLIRDMAPFCTAGKLHAGLDESFHLGKCPRCAAEVKRKGLGYHFSEHVRRIHALVSGQGLRLGMWADMLTFVPEAIERLPAGIVAYDWYYYPFRRLPRVELFNFAEVDLATPLKKRGIEYWGCPMNGAFRWEPLPVFRDRLANIRSWWKHCRRTGAAGMLISSWEAYRLALETTTVVDAAAASLWLDGDGADASDEVLLQRGFARVFGKAGAARTSRLALSADAYPYSGYARWELNTRWDLRAAPTSVATAAAEARHFSRLKRESRGLPEPLPASLKFRSYLADREYWVAAAADSVWTIRRQLSSGRSTAAAKRLAQLDREAAAFATRLREDRAAAKTMWRRTRFSNWPSQNAALLSGDEERLRTWRNWIAHARDDLKRVWDESPVCGAWQLYFTVRNFVPALQRISVEQSLADGTWKELHARHTIEFQARGAQPRTNVERLFSVPVDLPPGRSTAAFHLPRLRVVVRGLGQVRLSSAELTNGVDAYVYPRDEKKPLGKPAPRRGLPALDEELGVWRLSAPKPRNRR